MSPLLMLVSVQLDQKRTKFFFIFSAFQSGTHKILANKKYFLGEHLEGDSTVIQDYNNKSTKLGIAVPKNNMVVIPLL